jgi:4-amino-4-deoxy-L-arabinose transferase-like glycosyltransferase
MEPERPATKTGRRAVLATCTALTLVFAALSYGAALRKSPTYDEPHHLLGGYLASRQDDYRFDVEHPALFRRLAALTVPANALRVPFPDRDQHKRVPMLHNPALSEEQLYREFPDVDAFRWAMVMRTLFQTEGVDPEALIDRARLPFALLGASLVALIAWWAWRLAGGTAAVAAAVLLAFDPTFLGHSALVKNDAPIAALMTAVMFAAWCVGRRATVVNATALVVAFAAALNMKNSGVLLAPFLALAFLIRALMPLDWPAFGKVLAKRRQRFVLAAAIGLVTALAAAGSTWALNGFRWAPTAEAELRLDSESLAEATVENLIDLRLGEMLDAGVPRDEVLNADLPRPERPLSVRLALWIEQQRLMPQAWTYGLLYMMSQSVARNTFLLGERSTIGSAWYFPLAMLWKTPVATLIAVLLLPVIALGWALRRRSLQRGPAVRRSWQPAWPGVWSICCVGIVPLIYGAISLSTNMNIGVRYVLPIYPFLFVTAAVSFAYVCSQWRRAARVGGALAALLAIESLAAWPDYISFFNFPSGGARGGIFLLSDSNLDWGQDLKALAAWREEHADEPLYLCYFGGSDPRIWVPDAILLPGGSAADGKPPPTGIAADAWVALSATCIQGTYMLGQEPLHRALRQLISKMRLVDVLGGTIYVYRMPSAPRRNGR